MSKYEVLIERISSRHNNGYRYVITVWWDKPGGSGDVSWSFTLWGARREAKRLIKKHEDKEPPAVKVEEYQL